MRKANERQLRAAVHIAATVMRSAGLCKMGDAFRCKRSDGGHDARFSCCVDCIERWLYVKARDRCPEEQPPRKVWAWTRVDKRLPEMHDVTDDEGLHYSTSAPVLVYCAGADPALRIRVGIVEASPGEHAVWVGDEFGEQLTVTHWMPLPVPPGGDCCV